MLMEVFTATIVSTGKQIKFEIATGLMGDDFTRAFIIDDTLDTIAKRNHTTFDDIIFVSHGTRIVECLDDNDVGTRH